jgi:hypothetical protein
MFKTNKDRLVKISVAGQIDAPRFPAVPWTPHFISREGKPTLLPLNGGIVYNVRVGDLAMGWAAELVEPCVSIRAKDDAAHRALKVFACVGNEAVIMSGRAKGAKGTVTGKSGRFMDHVSIDFAPDALESLSVGDTIVVKAFGRGTAIEGFPGIQVKNVDPDLLLKMGIVVSDGKLQMPVVATLPAEVMGAGSGLDSDGGCLQIQTGSPGVVEAYGLQNLRLGDVIAVQDYECRYAPGFLRGAMSIGIVGHGDSVRMGFGPGMTIIMTASDGEIEPVQGPEANIARMLGLGTYRQSTLSEIRLTTTS